MEQKDDKKKKKKSIFSYMMNKQDPTNSIPPHYQPTFHYNMTSWMLLHISIIYTSATANTQTFQNSSQSYRGAGIEAMVVVDVADDVDGMDDSKSYCSHGGGG